MRHILKAIKSTNHGLTPGFGELIRVSSGQTILYWAVRPESDYRWLAAPGGEIVVIDDKSELRVDALSFETRLYWDDDYIDWLADDFDMQIELEEVARMRARLLGHYE